MADKKPKLTADEKKAKKKAEQEKEFLEAHDESFQGLLALYTVDNDGIPLRTNGKSVTQIHVFRHDAPDGGVLLRAIMPADKVSRLRLDNDDKLNLCGAINFGLGSKPEPNTTICILPPTGMKEICAEEKTTQGGVVECSFDNRACEWTLGTKEKKFVTFMETIEVKLSKASWEDFKQFRLKGHRLKKAGEPKPDEKDDEDEDEEKKKKKDEE